MTAIKEMVVEEDDAAEGVVVAGAVEKAATEDINKADTTDPKMTTETGIIKNISPKTYSATSIVGKGPCCSGDETNGKRRTEMKSILRKIGSFTES